MKKNDYEDDMEIPVLTDDIKSEVRNCNGEWINQSAKPIKNIKCYIDNQLVNTVRDIQDCVERKLGGSNEFGGYVKWHWQSDGSIKVDDIMIPKQVVGGATVDFRSPANPEYTGVFHKHPNGCRSFSGTDDNYINANNDLSILFEGGNFITGIVNIPLPDTNIRFQTHVTIIEVRKGRKDLDVSMIESASSFREKIRTPFVETVRTPPPSLASLGTDTLKLPPQMVWGCQDDEFPF